MVDEKIIIYDSQQEGSTNCGRLFRIHGVISRDLRLFSPAKLAATRNAVKKNLQLLDVNPDDLQSMHTAFKKSITGGKKSIWVYTVDRSNRHITFQS